VIPSGPQEFGGIVVRWVNQVYTCVIGAESSEAGSRKALGRFCPAGSK